MLSFLKEILSSSVNPVEDQLRKEFGHCLGDEISLKHIIPGQHDICTTEDNVVLPMTITAINIFLEPGFLDRPALIATLQCDICGRVTWLDQTGRERSETIWD